MWRTMNSLIVLRAQVNAIAPGRSKKSDGTICDDLHESDSDHCPHFVANVGAEMVTALDLTHDPTGGFDSYLFAEVLRIHRDQRIKYVISNRRKFSSYATSSYPAWTWRPYSGSDPHTNHVHISVLDAPISDTTTPWNLEGFASDMTPGQQYVLHVINYRIDAIIHMRPICNVPAYTASDGSKFPAITETNQLAVAVNQLLTTGGITPENIAEIATAVADAVDDSIPTAQETATATVQELTRELGD